MASTSRPGGERVCDFPVAGLTEATVRNLIDNIWSPLTASIVFLFDKTYQDDANKPRRISRARERSPEHHRESPTRGASGHQDFVTTTLRDRDLLDR